MFHVLNIRCANGEQAHYNLTILIVLIFRRKEFEAYLIMTTSSILNEIIDGEKLIEAQIPRFESFEENLKLIEKTRRRIANADINSTTKQNNEVNNSFNQQLRNAKTTMLRLHNLQRTRLLKQ